MESPAWTARRHARIRPMGRLSVAEVVARKWLRCPRCHGDLGQMMTGTEMLCCDNCGADYPVAEVGVPQLVPSGDRITERTQEFWGSLYKAAYAGRHGKLTRTTIERELSELRQMFEHRDHLAVREMPIAELSGRLVLEIGSGAGAHSALFSQHGARMVSLDVTLERAAATARVLDFVTNSDNFCLQADALALPFPDELFDIVYSNGVLHHTASVSRAVQELHRVLKPGGRAVVMLYARNSFVYRGVLLPIRGVLQGRAWRDPEWLGRSTEWMSDRRQTVTNPRTEVFSGGEVQQLFRGFRNVRVRKNGFVFDQIPLLGRWIGRAAGIFTGVDPAGTLVYDKPWRNETRFELWAGRYIGWGLNILAVK